MIKKISLVIAFGIVSIIANAQQDSLKQDSLKLPFAIHDEKNYRMKI